MRSPSARRTRLETLENRCLLTVTATDTVVEDSLDFDQALVPYVSQPLSSDALADFPQLDDQRALERGVKPIDYSAKPVYSLRTFRPAATDRPVLLATHADSEVVIEQNLSSLVVPKPDDYLLGPDDVLSVTVRGQNEAP